jgi:hypothetical protein
MATIGWLPACEEEEESKLAVSCCCSSCLRLIAFVLSDECPRKNLQQRYLLTSFFLKIEPVFAFINTSLSTLHLGEPL